MSVLLVAQFVHMSQITQSKHLLLVSAETEGAKQAADAV